jgi:hypothetical protein
VAPDRIERINPKLNAVVTMDVHYWRHHADPDGIERDAAHDEAGRRLHLSPGLRGTGILDGPVRLCPSTWLFAGITRDVSFLRRRRVLLVTDALTRRAWARSKGQGLATSTHMRVRPCWS